MLPFKIAYRFLISNKTQMVLISLGIAIGLSVQIFIGSLITGLQESLVDRTVGTSPHITIENSAKNQYISEDTNYTIPDNKAIKSAAKTVNGSAIITKDKSSYPVVVRGLELEEADKIYQINNRLIKGSLPVNNNEVIVGLSLFNDLKLKVGNELTINLVDKTQAKLKVVGYYDFKVAALNDSWLISDLTTVQNIFGLENQISSIEIQVKDVFMADKIAKEIKSDAQVTSWQASNEQLLSGLQGQSMSSYIIQVFVMISVVLGIASVLIISVVQKQRQIGILKAMGLNDSMASRVFLYQGLMLGVLGATLGVLLGYLLTLGFTTFALDTNGDPIVAINLKAGFITTSWFIALAASLIASIIPSLSSRKLSPMEVIKNG